VVWTAVIWFRMGPVEGSCEHGNESSGYIKCWKVLSSCTTGDISRRAQLQGVSYLEVEERHRGLV
jgi:hypothetical protein